MMKIGSLCVGLTLLFSPSLQARVATDANFNYCVYESDIATGLGVGSFLFLMASQLLIMAATRCLCCGRALRPSRSRVWAIVLFITCWYIFQIVVQVSYGFIHVVSFVYRYNLHRHLLRLSILQRNVSILKITVTLPMVLVYILQDAHLTI